MDQPTTTHITYGLPLDVTLRGQHVERTALAGVDVTEFYTAHDKQQIARIAQQPAPETQPA